MAVAAHSVGSRLSQTLELQDCQCMLRRRLQHLPAHAGPASPAVPSAFPASFRKTAHQELEVLPFVCAVWWLVPRPGCGVQRRKKCTPVSHLQGHLAVLSPHMAPPWRRLGHMLWGLPRELTGRALSLAAADAAMLCNYFLVPVFFNVQCIPLCVQ